MSPSHNEPAAQVVREIRQELFEQKIEHMIHCRAMEGLQELVFEQIPAALICVSFLRNVSGTRTATLPS
jgi:hypothetical protein